MLFSLTKTKIWPIYISNLEPLSKKYFLLNYFRRFLSFFSWKHLKKPFFDEVLGFNVRRLLLGFWQFFAVRFVCWLFPYCFSAPHLPFCILLCDAGDGTWEYYISFLLTDSSLSEMLGHWKLASKRMEMLILVCLLFAVSTQHWCFTLAVAIGWSLCLQYLGTNFILLFQRYQH